MAVQFLDKKDTPDQAIDNMKHANKFTFDGVYFIGSITSLNW